MRAPTVDERDEWLHGTAGAPLAATVRYSFRRVTSALVDPRLEVPLTQLGALDVCAHPEQAAFVARFVRSLGLAVRTPRPGVWFFDDDAALAVLWSGLATQLAEPDVTAPFANAQREHRLDLDTARTRFFMLVADLLGLEDVAFERRARSEGDSGFAATSEEVWARGDVKVQISTELLESSQGIHGQVITLTLAGEHAGKRSARAYLSDDARSGASCSVHVAGVRSAQELADAFVR